MKNISKETKVKIIKTLVVVFLLAAIVLAIYLPLKFTGALEKIDSAEKLRDVINGYGVYSYIAYFIIQFLQTTILPIPAIITTVAGTLIFGPWITIALSLSAILLGSSFSFFLGKKIGRKIVVWIAGEKDTLKWEEKLSKGKYVFFLMMLFPLFPDDILCIVVGTTNMSWKFFLITNIITRPISIIMTAFLGSGTIIPFSGWGIPVWIVLVLLALFCFYISIRYQEKIENFVLKLSGKMSKKEAELKNKREENIPVSETSQEEFVSTENVGEENQTEKTDQKEEK